MAMFKSRTSIALSRYAGLVTVVPALGYLLACTLGCSAVGVGKARNPAGEPLNPPDDASPVAAMALETLTQRAIVGRIDPMFEQGVSYRVMGSFSEDGETYHAVCADTEEPIWSFCLAIGADGRLKRGRSRFYLLAGPDGVKFRTHYQRPSPPRTGDSPLFRLVTPGATDAEKVVSAIAMGPYPQAWDKDTEGRAGASDLDLSGCDVAAGDDDAIRTVLRAVVRVRELKSQGVTYEVYVRSVADTAADISVAATQLSEQCRSWLDHVRWIVEKYSLAGQIWSRQLQRHALEDSQFDANARRHRELAPLRLEWRGSAYRPLMDALWQEAATRVEELLDAMRSSRGD